MLFFFRSLERELIVPAAKGVANASRFPGNRRNNWGHLAPLHVVVSEDLKLSEVPVRTNELK